MTIRLACFALLLLGACTRTSPSPATSGGDAERPRDEPERPRDEPETITPCESDDDCRLSCVGCCGSPCGCETVRHREDHTRAKAALTCTKADRAECVDVACGAPSYDVVPRCKARQCVIERIEHDAPPPSESPTE